MPAPKLQSLLTDSRWEPKTSADHRIVFDQSVAVGDTILIGGTAWNFAADDTTKPIASFADQLGNVYTIVTQTQTGNTSHHYAVIAFCRVTVAGTPIITPTLNHTNDYNSFKARAYVWDCFYSSPVDKVATGTGSVNATSATTPSQTLSQTAPFMVFSVYTAGQLGGGRTPPSGFTVLDDGLMLTDGSTGEMDYAAAFLDVTAASSAGAAVTWGSGASVNGTVAATAFLRLGCRAVGRVSTLGQGATGCTVHVWPSGDETTSLATRFTGRTIDSSGYVRVPADVAWQKAVGATVLMDVRAGTDAATSVTGTAGPGGATIEIGVA